MLSLLSWRGRMNGRDYFAAQFAILLATLLIAQLGVSHSQQPAVNVLILPAGLVVVYFFSVTTIRRFHDMGRSGWNLLWVCLCLSALQSILGVLESILGVLGLSVLVSIVEHLRVSLVWLYIGVAWIVQQPSAPTANEWGPALLVPDDAIARVADSPFAYIVLALPAIFHELVLILASSAP